MNLENLCGFFSVRLKERPCDWLAHLFNWSRGFGAWRLIAQQISTNLEQQIAKLFGALYLNVMFLNQKMVNVLCFWNKVVSWPGLAHRWVNVCCWCREMHAFHSQLLLVFRTLSIFFSFSLNFIFCLFFFLCNSYIWAYLLPAVFFLFFVHIIFW